MYSNSLSSFSAFNQNYAVGDNQSFVERFEPISAIHSQPPPIPSELVRVNDCSHDDFDLRVERGLPPENRFDLVSSGFPEHDPQSEGAVSFLRTKVGHSEGLLWSHPESQVSTRTHSAYTVRHDRDPSAPFPHVQLDVVAGLPSISNSFSRLRPHQSQQQHQQESLLPQPHMGTTLHTHRQSAPIFVQQQQHQQHQLHQDTALAPFPGSSVSQTDNKLMAKAQLALNRMTQTIKSMSEEMAMLSQVLEMRRTAPLGSNMNSNVNMSVNMPFEAESSYSRASSVNALPLDGLRSSQFRDRGNSQQPRQQQQHHQQQQQQQLHQQQQQLQQQQHLCSQMNYASPPSHNCDSYRAPSSQEPAVSSFPNTASPQCQPSSTCSPVQNKILAILRHDTVLHEVWYAERPFPAFTLDIVDESLHTKDLISTTKDWKVDVTLEDGFGGNATNKLHWVSDSAVVIGGAVTISGVRFSGVSSKSGGFFRIVVTITAQPTSSSPSCLTAIFKSPPIQVLSYRLFHAPKVASEKLQPSDSVGKVKGIGTLYAKRLKSLGIGTVQNLASLDVHQLGDEGCKHLLAALRKDRGSMTLEKLVKYIEDARSIVMRYNSNGSSTPPSSRASPAPSPQPITSNCVPGSGGVGQPLLPSLSAKRALEMFDVEDMLHSKRHCVTVPDEAGVYEATM
eukprot:c8748_g1_i1.p1 GENE.c8748_g1_i1~~c8748_g1_i1.p1  ORF type:complete len:676 (-),score=160.00 c8748_g1_i1:239-2266(-)